MPRTHYAHYTDDELLSIVYADSEANEMTVELALRLEKLLDDHDAWTDDAPELPLGVPQ